MSRGPTTTQEVGAAERTAANSLFSLASFVVTALAVAVTTPIVIHHLGAEQYGIFSLSLTVVSLLALLDAGISTALVRFVADRWALGDIAGINRLVSTSFGIYLILGVVAVLGTTVVSIYFVDDLFNLTKPAVRPAEFAFFVAGIAFFFTFLSKIFGAVIIGLQRNAVSAALRVAISIWRRSRSRWRLGSLPKAGASSLCSCTCARHASSFSSW